MADEEKGQTATNSQSVDGAAAAASVGPSAPSVDVQTPASGSKEIGTPVVNGVSDQVVRPTIADDVPMTGVEAGFYRVRGAEPLLIYCFKYFGF